MRDNLIGITTIITIITIRIKIINITICNRLIFWGKLRVVIQIII